MSEEMHKEHERKAESEVIKINLSSAKKFFNNPFTTWFSVLAGLTLIIILMGLVNVGTSIQFLSRIFAAFSRGILVLLLTALAFSAVLAHFKKFKLMFLPLFVWLLIFNVSIRTGNIEGLIDVTTGSYTLGPDLDPFLYLRHAQEIVGGKLENPDYMRSAPLGSDNYALKNLMPVAIVIVFKIISAIGNPDLTYAAIISPIIFFSISIIGFFLFVKSAFSMRFSKNFSNGIAILASLIYIAIPQMLHRTTAGIPEIESLGMVWFWFAFYFLVSAWKSPNEKKQILFGILAGILTGLMSWTWGGYRYIYLSISLTAFIFFLFEVNKRKNLVILSSWIVPALILEWIRVGDIMGIFTRISDTGFGVGIFLVIALSSFVDRYKIKEKLKIHKVQPNIVNFIVSILILALALIIVNPGFLTKIIPSLIDGLLYPFGRGRVGLTVAENKAPYFVEALSAFGSLFWIFLLGIVLIFWATTKGLGVKKRAVLSLLFTVLVAGVAFTRFSPNNIFNGESQISQIVYIGSIIIFGGYLVYMFIKAKNKEEAHSLEWFKGLDFGEVLILSLSFFALISIRGAIRLFFIVSPIVAIVSAFVPFFVIYHLRNKEHQDGMKRLFLWAVAVISIFLILTNVVGYAGDSAYQTKGTIPNSYTQQWQKAMAWVRENTGPDSIFVHWWDYGYWVQTLGERPTVVDGGHFIGYWNHLVGRYLLTTPNPETALSFMKTHNVSYLLIDSSDVGKYPAYSSIGNDEEKDDRYSWIPVMVTDQRQTQETSTGTIRVYAGGTAIDQDIIYEINGSQVFLPALRAGVAGVLIETNQDNNTVSFNQPVGIFVYNSQRYDIPLRYLYYNGELVDFKSGIETAVAIIPLVYSTDNQQVQVDGLGTLMYFSEKTKDSLFVQLYIMDDPLNTYSTLKLARSEPDFFVNSLNSQGLNLGEFVYYNGFRGPIKIWEVDYPENIIEREEFLRTSGGYGEFDDLQFTK
jgi:asparagine N-glycosylation enzyme membrane subunit Stt3